MNQILESSMVLYIPLYEVDSGSFVSRDAYGHLSTLSGAIWKLQGRDFDGIDDAIVIPHALSIAPSEITVDMWCRLNSIQVSTQYANPIGKDHSGTTGITLQIDHAQSSSEYWHVGNGAGLYSVNYNIPNASFLDDQWHHLAMTKSSTLGMAIYRDGVLIISQASYTTPVAFSTGDWYIGRANIADRIAKMTGGEVRIYNRALTPQEIERNYLATKWRYR